MKPAKRLDRARQRVNLIVTALRAVPHSRYVIVLTALLGLVVLRSAIGAHVRGTWILENTPVVLAVLFLWSTYERMPMGVYQWAMFPHPLAHEPPIRSGDSTTCAARRRSHCSWATTATRSR